MNKRASFPEPESPASRRAIFPKNLCVNHVCLEWHFPKAIRTAASQFRATKLRSNFFVSHAQFAKAVEPAMADVDHPPPGLLLWIALLDIGFFAAIDGMRNVTLCFDDDQFDAAAVPGVGTQVLAATVGRDLTLDHDGVEHLLQPLAVIDLRPGHDERQGDATAVQQQEALAAFDFRDPWNSGRLLPGPRAPSSWRRPRAAIARRRPPCRRIPPTRLSTPIQRSRPLPIREIACGWRWHCQNAPWAVPSIGNPCAAHTRSPRTLVLQASGVSRHQACADTSCLATAPFEVPAALPAETGFCSPRNRVTTARVYLLCM